MISRYIQRTLEQVVKRAVNEFPAIVLTGPRQSGKTTLLKHLFDQSHRYVSLELPDVRAAVTADPRAFLEMNLPPVIFDEVQGENPQVYFWRTTAGTEVYFVIESGGKLIPIEVKLSATPRPGMASGIRTFQKDFGDRTTTGFVIHPGDVCLPLSPNVTALPFARL